MTVPEEEGEVVGHGVRGAHQRGGHGSLQHSTQREDTIIFYGQETRETRDFRAHSDMVENERVRSQRVRLQGVEPTPSNTPRNINNRYINS